MEFAEGFFKAEVRCDHFVDKKMKKTWAVEMNILEQIDIICKRHNITYFAGYGTLLGTARHNGFIPWDDDIDIVMLRDDYAKFLNVAKEELPEHYFLQNAYTDMCIMPFSKVRDDRTTAIEFPDQPPEFNQGMFVDVFPMDVARDGSPEADSAFYIAYALWDTLCDPQSVLEYVNNPQGAQVKYIMEPQMMKAILSMSPAQRYTMFEQFLLEHRMESSEVCSFATEIMPNIPKRHYKREWFSETIYMDYEGFKMPVPKDYEKILDLCYGDWHTPVKGGTFHEGIIMDPEVPYKETLIKLRQKGD